MPHGHQSQQYSHSWRDLQNSYSMANDLATRSVSLDIQDCKWLCNNEVLHRRWKDYYPPIYLSAHPFVHPIFHLSIQPSIQPSLCPSMRSSFCLSVCPTIPMSLHAFVHPLAHFSVSVHPSCFLSFHPSTHPLYLMLWKRGVCLISHHHFNCLTCKWVAFSKELSEHKFRITMKCVSTNKIWVCKNKK